MTERDLERILHQSVQDVHLSDEARRRIRLSAKEERPVRMKKFVAIALALVLMLTTTAAVAAELGLFDFLQKTMGQTVLPGANELIKTDVASGETDAMIYTIKQAVYDGKSVSLLVEMRAKDDKTFLMGQAWMPEEPIRDYQYFTVGIDPNDERTIAQYAADHGYTRFANVSVEINAGDYSGLDEWNNNVLTVLYSFDTEGAELNLPIEYYSRTYTLDSTDEPQRVKDTITLKACEPLWMVSSNESFDAPGFGIRVDNITLTGTPVQSYWALTYTITDVEIARNLGWNANVVDMNKEYFERGVLGSGGAAMPEYNGQVIVEHGAIAAIETPPTELMILLRNWDDHSLNNYFPVTLK